MHRGHKLEPVGHINLTNNLYLPFVLLLKNSNSLTVFKNHEMSDKNEKCWLLLKKNTIYDKSGHTFLWAE